VEVRYAHRVVERKPLCRWQLGREKRYQINKSFQQIALTFTAAAAWPAVSYTEYL
jgi:hypothetical protein